ncbi:hypothetical protein LOC54_09285 [Acetobacter sp. AN02]|uniref:hypothetical protein n=1 Tax=Acetobacter sp. AN02 TaxID=2894186 RepID=UPI00243426A6|nr:hypothetical protein [Acetobacter sp. AN02]MDG6095293.1 hypothetical protein [Acetobacter sp. AN02]
MKCAKTATGVILAAAASMVFPALAFPFYRDRQDRKALSGLHPLPSAAADLPDIPDDDPPYEDWDIGTGVRGYIWHAGSFCFSTDLLNIPGVM